MKELTKKENDILDSFEDVIQNQVRLYKKKRKNHLMVADEARTLVDLSISLNKVFSMKGYNEKDYTRSHSEMSSGTSST